MQTDFKSQENHLKLVMHYNIQFLLWMTLRLFQDKIDFPQFTRKKLQDKSMNYKNKIIKPSQSPYSQIASNGGSSCCNPSDFTIYEDSEKSHSRLISFKTCTAVTFDRSLVCKAIVLICKELPV